MWVSVCTRCLCYSELINEVTGRWRQGDKSCGVIKPKGHSEVTLTDATVASQTVKDNLPFSASGENQSWYLCHWRLQMNYCCSGEKACSHWCVVWKQQAAHSTEQLEMGLLSQYPVTQQYFLCFLNAQGFFFEDTQKVHKKWYDVELGWYKIALLAFIASWDAFWWTCNSSTVKFGNKNIKTEFSNNLYHFT